MRIANQVEGGASFDYQIIKERVRHQLDVFVDEPEFQDFFNAIIHLGCDNAPFLPDLVDFASKFVDPKRRQLRMTAFVDVNKFGDNLPRYKIATLKRCLRRKPNYGFCPSPEGCLGVAGKDVAVHNVERLLQYFHVECKDALAALGDGYKRAQFLDSVDVASVEAYASCNVRNATAQYGNA